MNIRPATDGDYTAILRLLRHLNHDDPEVADEIGRATFTRIVESTDFIILVAEQSQKPIGTCYLNLIPNLTRGASPYALIENVVVDPSVRRQGVGEALIDYAMQLAKDNGCYKVMLLTGRDRKVHRFYQSCGMESESKTAFITRFDHN